MKGSIVDSRRKQTPIREVSDFSMPYTESMAKDNVFQKAV